MLSVKYWDKSTEDVKANRLVWDSGWKSRLDIELEITAIKMISEAKARNRRESKNRMSSL